MPWHVGEQGAGDCGEAEWPVILDEDGSTVACHDTEAEAEAQVRALYQSEREEEEGASAGLFIGEAHPDAPDDRPWALAHRDGTVVDFYPNREEAAAALIAAQPVLQDVPAGSEVPWEAVLMFEGVETGDGRIFEDVTWRNLPLTLLTQFETQWGHDGARISGRIDTVTQSGNEVRASGVFDTASEAGAETARLVEARTLRGVSVDLGEVGAVEYEVRSMDADGWPTDVLERYVGVAIMGATVLPFPAFAGAEIWVAGSDNGSEPTEVPAEVPAAGEAAGARVRARVASARPQSVLAGGEVEVPCPTPAAWLTPLRLNERTPLDISPEGEVAGHIYGWGECHIGSPAGACITAPPSATDYAYFRTGAVLADDGRQVATGPLVIDADHAELAGLSWLAAKDHYANAALAVADVAIGEDKHGIWVHGTVRPGTSQVKLHALRASAPSGDWRKIGGHLELIACLAVNTPGYPMPRALVSAGGEVEALVAAAGIVQAAGRDGGCGCGGNDTAALADRVKRLEAIMRPLRGQARAALLERIREN